MDRVTFPVAFYNSCDVAVREELSSSKIFYNFVSDMNG
jgi:hypothetical protein